jgi:hypothetical protein
MKLEGFFNISSSRVLSLHTQPTNHNDSILIILAIRVFVFDFQKPLTIARFILWRYSFTFTIKARYTILNSKYFHSFLFIVLLT